MKDARSTMNEEGCFDSIFWVAVLIAFTIAMLYGWAWWCLSGPLLTNELPRINHSSRISVQPVAKAVPYNPSDTK